MPCEDHPDFAALPARVREYLNVLKNRLEDTEAKLAQIRARHTPTEIVITAHEGASRWCNGCGEPYPCLDLQIVGYAAWVPRR